MLFCNDSLAIQIKFSKLKTKSTHTMPNMPISYSLWYFVISGIGLIDINAIHMYRLQALLIIVSIHVQDAVVLLVFSFVQVDTH